MQFKVEKCKIGAIGQIFEKKSLQDNDLSSFLLAVVLLSAALFDQTPQFSLTDRHNPFQILHEGKVSKR